MRILVVAEQFPWPPTGGGMIRLAKAIEAFADLGEVDLFSFYDERLSDPTAVPPDVGITRLEAAPWPQYPHQFRWRASWLLRGGSPMEVEMGRFDDRPRRSFESWVGDGYDLVWFSTAMAYQWLGRPHLGPTVVDLVDLEDEKARQRSALLWSTGPRGTVAATVKRLLAVAQARLNARDWRAFQRSVARQADRVVLCTDLDAARSGLPKVAVVRNSYERPSVPVGRSSPGRPPAILFQGTLSYGPNFDGANWLVGELAPRLRERVPDAQIRLVGRPIPGVERLDDPPRVTVVGMVPSMEPELARAALVAVPIRFGSGSRLKILESFAHRVPVVSTTMGADGLDVEDGTHLLIADDADDFAAACERLLTDPDLRHRIVDAAEERYAERYQWPAARRDLLTLVDELVGEGSPL